MDFLSHFQAIRKSIFDKMHNNSILLLAAAPTCYRNGDAEYPYRQESTFYYLTGFEESDAIVALIKQGNRHQFILFCQEKDPALEQWTGARAGVIDACKVFGADEAFSIKEVEKKLPDLLNGLETIYYLIDAQPAFEKIVFSALKTLRHKVRQGETPYQFIDVRAIVNELRLIKTPQEVAWIRTACEISVEGHQQAMTHCRPGMHEYALEGVLLEAFYKRGARNVAYTSIVAGGNNACTLHYTRNNAPLKDNTLVLIDAGAEYQGYAADITRTFPVNGKFTPAQQAIYELVLAAQQAAIATIAPGLAWDNIQKTLLTVLVQGLVDLKILQGNVATLIEEKAYLPFYMHSSGHWLGLDVHDVGSYQYQGSARTLSPGMVLTIEPGLYLSENLPNLAPQWQGIGVRIEDDICVTPAGHDVLTQGLPKTVKELEHACKMR